MFKRFSQVSLEGYNGGVSNLSMEEEEVVRAELGELGNEIESDLREADAAVDAADDLGDVVAVVEPIESATRPEVELTEIATRRAADAVGEPMEDLAPALEGYIGRSISTESIKSKLQTIWRNIVEFVKRIWAKIKAYVKKFFSAVSPLERAIKSLRKEVDNLGSASIKNEDRKLKITSGIELMTVDNVPVKTAADLARGLTVWEDIASTVLVKDLRTVAKFGERVADALDKFDASKPESGATVIVNAIPDSKAVAVAVSTVAVTKDNDLSDVDYEIECSVPLLGNVSVFSGHMAKPAKPIRPLETLFAFRKTKLTLSATSSRKRDLPTEVVFEAMSKTEMNKVLDAVEGIVKQLGIYSTSRLVNDCEKAQERMEKAGARALKDIESERQNGDNYAEQEWRGLVGLSTTYAHLVGGLPRAVASKATNVSKQALSLVAKSLRVYS